MGNDGWDQILAHRERLLAVARRRCPSLADAEDVVHEAMLRCATFGNLDAERLGQFLTSVTMRLCADLHRSADRDGRIAVRIAAEPERHELGPEDETCGKAYAQAIEALVDTLPERQRVVLSDRAHGLTMNQICKRRSLTYKAAESALARARGTMRQMLPSLMAGLTVVGALLRRRRAVVAVATVPVVAVLALSGVVKLPFLGTRPPATHAMPDVPFVLGEPLDPAAHVTRAPAAAPAATPSLATKPSQGDGHGHGHKKPKNPPVVTVGDPDDPVIQVTNDSPFLDDPVGYVEMCSNGGVWLDTTDPLSPKQGCGN